MRNVERSRRPKSLTENAARWTAELLREKRKKRPDPRRVRSLTDRYRKADVRDALDGMYGGLCCYCEAEIGVVAVGHIEHRKPKKKYPRECFTWPNLHLGCPNCNQAKGQEWVAKDPILDAVKDVPIGGHLSYRLIGGIGVQRSARTKRGRTTIDLADLNRTKLSTARLLVAMQALDLIRELNEDPDSLQAPEIRRELSEKTKGMYGSLVQWLIDTFLRTR